YCIVLHYYIYYVTVFVIVFIFFILFFFFFFSSRRRHTRSKRDWSSDVCSSDLIAPFTFFFSLLAFSINCAIRLRIVFKIPPASRSEERRVGKECRSRWGVDQ